MRNEGSAIHGEGSQSVTKGFQLLTTGQCCLGISRCLGPMGILIHIWSTITGVEFRVKRQYAKVFNSLFQNNHSRRIHTCL